jgi:16S rRNA (guanine1207-N2)-methyltransferase
MSRWSLDPDRAADALIRRSVEGMAVAGRVLAVNQGGSLPSVLRERGADCVVWNRRLAAGMVATPWPPRGPFDLALVRLPKARDEQAMTMHAATSVLPDAGRLIVYGGNEEGIRSVSPMIEEIATEVTTIATRGHGRVLAARRARSAGALRATLEAWRTVSRLKIAGAERDWVSYPGCFATGRVDEGTALLLSVLPPLAPGARVLDYGCGTGAIAAAALSLEPGLRMDALDNDAVALEAVRENVPGARRVLGIRVVDAGRRHYHAILSNPPLHQGIAEDRGPLERLVSDAAAHLVPNGCLQLVVQQRVAIERLLTHHFPKAEAVAQTGQYRVWRAVASKA